MANQKSIRLSLAELLMLRHAMQIGAEDGSLLPQLDNGDLDPVEEERCRRISGKIEAAILALREAQGGQNV